MSASATQGGHNHHHHEVYFRQKSIDAIWKKAKQYLST